MTLVREMQLTEQGREVFDSSSSDEDCSLAEESVGATNFLGRWRFSGGIGFFNVEIKGGGLVIGLVAEDGEVSGDLHVCSGGMVAQLHLNGGQPWGLLMLQRERSDSRARLFFAATSDGQW